MAKRTVLQALEEIPSPLPGAIADTPHRPKPATSEKKGAASTTEESNAQVVYDYTAAPVKRRSKSLSRRRNRALRRLALAIVVLVIWGGASVAAAWWIYPRLQSADDLYTVAQSQLAEGRYERASLSFGQFARQNPTHHRGIDAQFESAWALTLIESPTADVATRLNEEALEKFQAFIEAHPSDEKCARAETLIGRLQYELGNYPAAIEMLRDPVRQLRDPEGALPVLRTLARAYRKPVRSTIARSTYIQAASLASNVTPEVDYQ